MNNIQESSNTEIKYVEGIGFIEEASELVPISFGDPDEECYIRETYFRKLEGTGYNDAKENY